VSAQSAQRSLSGDTSSEAIIDKDHVAPFEIREWCAAAIVPDPPAQLDSFSCREGSELIRSQAQRICAVGYDELVGSLRDGANTKLLVAGSPNLARDEHLERRPERTRHLKGNRYTTSWQRQDHRRDEAVLSKTSGQRFTCRAAVAEMNRSMRSGIHHPFVYPLRKRGNTLPCRTCPLVRCPAAELSHARRSVSAGDLVREVAKGAADRFAVFRSASLAKDTLGFGLC
jgi:hypothetical protein